MALLPKMIAGAEWTGPVLLDDEVAAAIKAAHPDQMEATKVRLTYMGTGVWPEHIALPETAQRFTLRTLSAAEAREAREAAGRQPNRWSWYQSEFKRSVERDVGKVFLPEGAPIPEGSTDVRPYPVVAAGETPDSKEYLARVMAWHVARGTMIERLNEKLMALAPPEVEDALNAFLAWRTRLAIERLSRAVVSMAPAWEVETPDGKQRLTLTFREGVEIHGVDEFGGGKGAELALELDAHLAREGSLGRRGKA